jgi:hypothetical protein
MKGTGTSFSFGLSKGAETVIYTTGSTYSISTTYLLIMKYIIVDGTTNDMVSLYILTGSIPATEPPVPSIGPVSDAGQSDLSNVAAVALRQYSGSQNIVIDGIRVAQKWEDAVSITTGIASLSIKNVPYIYPNPVINKLTIENRSDAELIEIRDLSGRVCFSIRRGLGKMDNLDVSSLKRGIYFVRITSISGTKTIKLIKE